MPGDDEALLYYFEELAWLRGMGAEFARKHERVASSLDFSAAPSSDPHVERLIESFAFLTSRIQRNLQAEFPRFTTALLDVLYPQLVQPVPPMAIARFEVDAKRAKQPAGHLVKKGESLIARSAEGLPCRFRTCYDTRLWSIHVRSASIEPARNFDGAGIDAPGAVSVLRLNLWSPAGKLSQLEGLTSLRFFIDGPPSVSYVLYDLLLTAVSSIWMRPAGDSGSRARPVKISPRSIRQVGFGLDEEVIPSPPQSHPAYRLIQEYFHFPEKFRFFDLRHLEERPKEEDKDKDYDTLELLFFLERSSGRIQVSAKNFVLGCTPIVNLFRKLSEPIRINHRSLEYRLIGDARREYTTEIHSVESVSASSNPDERAVRYHPFFSFRHDWEGAEPRAFWMARRAPTGRADLPGTDIWLSFLNLDFEPANPADEVVYAHTLATNRELALQLRENAELQMETETHSVSCLVRPTAPAPPVLDGPTVWRLISNLSLNNLSLDSSEAALIGLREVLRIYALKDGPAVQRQIDGISRMKQRQALRRFATKTSRSARQWAFRAGTQVELTFDESMYTGSSAIVLASVLRHFLALHTSINSFVEVRARRLGDEKSHIWKRWAPRSGDQPVR